MVNKNIRIPVWIIVVMAFAMLSAGSSTEKNVTGSKVRSKTVWISETVKGVKTNYRDEYYLYDRKGNELTYINYKKDGSVTEKVEQRYDKFGNRIEKKVFENVKARKAETIQEHTTYKYNAHGKRIEEAELQPDGQINSRTAISYNNEGKRVKELVYGKKGELKRQIVFTYNRNKLQETKITMNASGDTLTIRKNVYEYH